MINRAKMPRQLRGKGGITNVVPRKRYGLGSDLKDRFRKLIPNELADVAVKAAPFVAPFNPAAGALMRGIGRFDQRGSISDALKQGALTFGFGAGARKLGGAEDVFGGGLRDFSSPLSEGRTASVKNFFEGKKLTPEQKEKGKGILPENFLEKTTGKIPGVRALPKIVQEQLLAGGITAGASVLASYFQGDFREQEPGETMEDYLAARKDVVGKQMRTYMDSYFKFDPEYSALDDAGRDAFVARYNVRDGGMPTGIMRSNKAGVMERDYRDKGGFVPVGIKEKADDVPAMLSKNEFVMTANAVRGAGNGSIEKGAQRMYDTMKRLEKRAR
jgi:hypothetical protein